MAEVIVSKRSRAVVYHRKIVRFVDEFGQIKAYEDIYTLGHPFQVLIL